MKTIKYLSILLVIIVSALNVYAQATQMLAFQIVFADKSGQPALKTKTS